MASQDEWRFCGACYTLFHRRLNEPNSVCPAGGTHQAIGFNFLLPWVEEHVEVPDTHTAQGKWHFCKWCRALFYDGYPDKGVCPGHGRHERAGWNFVLPRELPETPTAQAHWRFCDTCHTLFFAGFPRMGHCANGREHLRIGSEFVLPHPIAPSLELQREGLVVTVFGRRYTPNANVKVSYGFDTGPTHTNREVDVATDVDGVFVEPPSFQLPSTRSTRIGARGIDQVTGTYADAQPL
jgi:hypothetical protein